MNRFDFLKRLLYYYAGMKYRHWIYIADSSDPFYIQEIKKVIDNFKTILNVRYFECPNYSVAESMKTLIDEVKTPYAAYIGDDDFLVPAGIDKCVDFLERNKDYTGANGKGILFSLKQRGAYGDFLSISAYRQAPVCYECATQRLMMFSNPHDYFVTLFSVHRIKVWKEMFKYHSISDKTFAGELFPCFISVIEGNIKHIDTLYLAHQVHQERYCLADPYDWVVSSQWNESYKIVFNSLVENLVRVDGISKENASDIVKQALWKYISVGLSYKFQQRYGRPRLRIKTRVKEIIKNIPFAAFVLRKSRISLSPVSLPALLNSKSPYYQDFIQIYNSVTQGNVDRREW